MKEGAVGNIHSVCPSSINPLDPASSLLSIPTPFDYSSKRSVGVKLPQSLFKQVLQLLKGFKPMLRERPGGNIQSFCPSFINPLDPVPSPSPIPIPLDSSPNRSVGVKLPQSLFKQVLQPLQRLKPTHYAKRKSWREYSICLPYIS